MPDIVNIFTLATFLQTGYLYAHNVMWNNMCGHDAVVGYVCDVQLTRPNVALISLTRLIVTDGIR